MQRINKIIAGITFLTSFLLYLITMAPTTSFWDCGEFIATSFIMGVPHPPGSPLFLLIGNFFSQLPFFSDVGARVNLISPIVSALAVMFLYLITVQLIEEWRGRVKSINDAIITFGGAFIGASTFAVTDSHWFNAVEAEVYALSTFFTAIVVWMIMKWSRHEGKSGNIRYILLISYMLGLASGIHLLNLLTLPFIALIVYYKKFDFKISSFLITGAISIGIYLFIYQGIIKGLPILSAQFGIKAPLVLVLSTMGIMLYFINKKNAQFATIFTCIVLIFVGYTSYTTIFIRANQHPRINENNPDTIKRAVSYLNREQYGDWSILDRKQSLLNSSYAGRWTTNKSNPKPAEVRDFVWNYQFKEMYLRYFAWQFIGREDSSNKSWHLYSKKGDIIKSLDGIDWKRFGIPLAFLIGLGGMAHHFARDWKNGLAVLSLFAATGVMIILYLNQYDPQPRERDYSYVGSFFAFSIWIGIGITGLMERIGNYFKKSNFNNNILISTSIILFLMMPMVMLKANYMDHNRSGNYVAWDYAYNMLNSCEPNGIIFTNGDNDTFPLWYIQEVEGLRKDVKVVNLSLLNTPWYIKQLRDDDPKLPIDMSNSDISGIRPSLWKAREFTLPGISKEDAGLKWQLKPTYGGQYLRVQDIMIIRLINDIGWKIPIYFAVTVSPENRIGLEDYLQMEGLVFRLRPEKTEQLNYSRMVQNITESPNPNNIIRTTDDYENYISSGEGIYRYTNLNNSKVYFNDNIHRLIQNYRSAFLQLSINNVYSSRSDKQERTLGLLKQMDRYFPPEILPLRNIDLELQIARLYKEAGDVDEYVDRLEKLRNSPNITIENLFYIGQLYAQDLGETEKAISIYEELKLQYPEEFEVVLALVQVYSQLDRQQEAVDLLNEWLILHPNHSQALQWLKLLGEIS